MDSEVLLRSDEIPDVNKQNVLQSINLYFQYLSQRRTAVLNLEDSNPTFHRAKATKPNSKYEVVK